jgi:hypothetical protein
LENGFTNVTVIDIAPSLTAALSAKIPDHNRSCIQIITGDFFTHSGEYDLILEQTFFCAINPSLRPQYVHQMHRLLAGSGRLAGLLFNRAFEGGPPFGGNMQEYRQLFSSLFRICTLETCYNSAAPRAGTECFLIAEKKP